MENKLYLFGFFYADGCLHKKTKKHKASLSVTISKKDSTIIDAFKQMFGGNTYIVKEEYARWYLSDLNLYSELESLNLTPKKTFNLKVPKLDCYKDFIRGYFDGDGSVYFSSQHGELRSEIWGTENFLKEISDILKEEIDPIMNIEVSFGKDKTYRLRFNQTQSILLCNWMYYDNCLCLKRKRDIFSNGIKRINSIKRTRLLWTAHDDRIIRTLYSEIGPVEISKKLLFKRSRQAIISRAHKLRNNS